MILLLVNLVVVFYIELHIALILVVLISTNKNMIDQVQFLTCSFGYIVPDRTSIRVCSGSIVDLIYVSSLFRVHNFDILLNRGKSENILTLVLLIIL